MLIVDSQIHLWEKGTPSPPSQEAQSRWLYRPLAQPFPASAIGPTSGCANNRGIDRVAMHRLAIVGAIGTASLSSSRARVKTGASSAAMPKSAGYDC